MNIKLLIASYWLPRSILKKELDQVAEVTIGCLDQLVYEVAPREYRAIHKEKQTMIGDLENRRKIMSTAHNLRVKVLIETLGYDDAVRVGREALFNAGLQLGQEARKRLKVGNSLQDLIRAARVLYQVLGIKFKIRKSGEEFLMIVDKCLLSKYYTPETCRILSAADEGVFQGLNPNIHMIFTQRMTEGPSECLACINCEI
ncbi:MAG: L-2-amino-thiazoline-4-carboxylic acid hydrolase [Methanobacterium sp.]|nr:L-2-amino-thiazoline-4-carboxylic acid hydrolase [Methanobacterium sp.]